MVNCRFLQMRSYEFVFIRPLLNGFRLNKFNQKRKFLLVVMITKIFDNVAVV